MSKYNLEFNKDDSVIRSMMAALLFEMQDKLSYTQTTEDDSDILDVPFYMSMVGSERYLMDKFLHDDVIDPKGLKAKGSYDPVPRGVLTFQTVEIDAQSMINKYIRTEILEKEAGTLKPYSYVTRIIPLILNFDTKIICNSMLEMLKITESIITDLYKNTRLAIDLGGYRVEGNVTIPENLDSERNIEFGFTDKKLFEINFSIQFSSFIPSFDKSTKMFAGNIMEGFEMSVDDIKNAPERGLYANVSNKATLADTDGLLPRGPKYVDDTEI